MFLFRGPSRYVELIQIQISIHPRSLTANAPEKWCLEDDRVLLGPGNFFQGQTVKLQGGTRMSMVLSKWMKSPL